MRYDMVLFDADGTLYDFKRSENEAIRAALIEYGLPCDNKTIALYSRINQGKWTLLEQGRITKEQLQHERFADLLKELGSDKNADGMNELYLRRLAEGTWLIDGAAELCAALRGRARMAIITNGIAQVQHRRVADSELNGYFEEIFVSEAVGAAKPDPRYFEYVSKSMGIEDKSKVLIVGDSLTTDIMGGQNAGIDTCWYNPNGLSYGGIVPCYEIKSLSEIQQICE